VVTSPLFVGDGDPAALSLQLAQPELVGPGSGRVGRVGQAGAGEQVSETVDETTPTGTSSYEPDDYPQQGKPEHPVVVSAMGQKFNRYIADGTGDPTYTGDADWFQFTLP
jgi:hypothetical protein